MRAVWLGLVIAALATACGRDAAPDAPDAAVGPTYYRDVAPILDAQCAGCHRAGGVGPFPLTSYGDALEVAQAIADATTDRVMPPWPADASGACGTFVDQRWLTDAQIATITAWVATGAAPGDPADAIAVTPPADPAFTPAVELASADPYYVGPGPDEYRCFVVDPKLVTDRYITALAVHLDRADVVHHIQLFAVDSDAADHAIAAKDAADLAPGYACDSEGLGAEVRYIGVWAAGDLVRRWPAGTGIAIHARRRIVLQLHYHNHTDAHIVDHTSVALELADTVERPAAIDAARPGTLELPPGRADVEVTAVQALPIATAGWVRAARMHMHTLGTHGRIELVHGDQTSCLLDIPRWDFSWQLFYTFDHPVAVVPGDQLRVTCGYDTRTRTQPVSWGISTDDEMCLGYTYVTP